MALVSGVRGGRQFAVDDTDVYYLEGDIQQSPSLFRVAKTGGTPTPVPLVRPLESWSGKVVVDATTIYVQDYGHNGFESKTPYVNGGVQLIYKNGSPSRLISATNTACHAAFVDDVAVGHGTIYWTQSNNPITADPNCADESSSYSLVAVRGNAAPATLLERNGRHYGLPLANASHLFWADGDAIWRMAPGGTPEKLASTRASALAIGGSALFGHYNPWSVLWKITAPGMENTLSGQTGYVDGFAADDSHVYLATGQGVRRFDHNGKNMIAVTPPSMGPLGSGNRRLAIDDLHIYTFDANFALIKACK